MFGANPNLPSVLTDKPPSLENTTINQNFANHLNALPSGRCAFIQAESFERIHGALKHKIRASGECYRQGERVYYKRDDDNKWKGPGTVICQDGKVAFVRHGNVYLRVHPCRLIRCGLECHEEELQKENSNDQQHQLNNTDSDDEHVQDLQTEQAIIPQQGQEDIAPIVIGPNVHDEEANDTV